MAEEKRKTTTAHPQKRGNPKKRHARKPREDDGLEQKIVDLARVTRVMQGGKRMSFRACVAVGDAKGAVGLGVAKGADVTISIQKAVNKAKKNMVRVPVKRDTIPHELDVHYKAAHLLLKPAKKGSGVKAGGVMRILLELGKVPNVTAKILGTNNKVTNAKAFMKGLELFKD